jgi:hypothetical protein
MAVFLKITQSHSVAYYNISQTNYDFIDTFRRSIPIPRCNATSDKSP